MEMIKLRKEFIRLLTEDSESQDKRRKGFNQALFSKESGRSIWNSLDLDMVMDTFDKATKNIRKSP